MGNSPGLGATVGRDLWGSKATRSFVQRLVGVTDQMSRARFERLFRSFPAAFSRSVVDRPAGGRVL